MSFKDFNSFSHVKALAILLGLSFIYLMLGNGALSLTHPDEVFYIQSAKEMLARNSWLTPYIFDSPQFEKPILSYWLFMLSIKAFGLTPFAGRFAPAVFGILAVLVTYGIAQILFKNKRLSFFSGLILASSAIHLAMSRAVLTDMIFTVWVILTIGAFYWAYDNPERKNIGLIMACIFSGIAVLAKGLLGICFPAGVALIFLLLRKDFDFLKNTRLFSGVVILLLIALPWHIYMYKLYGSDFIKEYFINDHWRRVIEAEHEKSNTWYFYPATIVLGVMPWTFILLPALAGFWSGFKDSRKENAPFLFLIAWLLGVFIFVQPAQSKLASYILPIFPAVAILLAHYLDRVFRMESLTVPFGLKWGAGLFLGVLFGAVAATPFLLKKFQHFIPSHVPVLVGVGICLGLGLCLLIGLIKKERFVLTCALSLLPLGLLIICFFAKAYAEPWVSCEQVSESLKAIGPSDGVVLSSKFYSRGVRYYTDRKIAVIDINGKQYFSPHPIPFLSSDQAVDQFLRYQPVTYCIVKKSNLNDLKRITATNGFLLTQINEIGGKYLLKITNPKF